MSLVPSVEPSKRRRFLLWYGVFALIFFVGLGVFARNGWLPTTDPLTGKRTGWFGAPLAKNAASSWNPLSAPLPTPTPQLSKEYVYAGSRLLAVEDVNATATPPADLAIWRPSGGAWYVRASDGSIAASASWGTTGDIAAPGDFDGDGKTDFCVFRPSSGIWYQILSSNNSTTGIGFGADGDIPVVADYDGDGKSDLAVYRPSTGYWYISRSSDSVTQYTQFGLSSDVPTPADFDGDGKADVTVWRSSNTTFYTTRTTDATLQTATFGNSGDTPVSADYDGDGKANYAVRSGASWIILDAAMSSTTTTTPTGDGATDLSTDKPVPNDYDGDGKCDIAVWRDSNGDWYIRKSGSSNALRQDHWGQSGDTPVPAYYRR